MSGWWDRLKHLGQEAWERGKAMLDAGVAAFQTYAERREHIEQLLRLPLPQMQQELTRAIPTMPAEDYNRFMGFLQNMILEHFPQRLILPTDPDRALALIAQESDQLARPQRVRVARLGTMMLMAWLLRQPRR